MFESLLSRSDVHSSVVVSVKSNIRILGVEGEREVLGVVDWHMPSSLNPKSYSISVPNTHGIRDMISKSGAFVVNFLGDEHSKKLRNASGVDGSLSDLFMVMGFSGVEAEKLDCPRVSEALAWLECQVSNELESGDHTVFTGRVLHFHVN